MFENSMFYQYTEVYFTEDSRLLAAIKNDDYLSEIIRLEKVLPLNCTPVLIEHRKQFYHLPLYWCDDVAVQSALKVNITRNYILSPLEISPLILARDVVKENPLPENVLKIVKSCLSQ